MTKRGKLAILYIFVGAMMLAGFQLSEKRAVQKNSSDVDLLSRVCVEKNDGLYICRFYDKHHNVLREETSTKLPHLKQISGDRIRYTTQAGTGIGTQWGFYFDGVNDVFSDDFIGIADEKDDLVVCCESDGIAVRSIFDDSFCSKVTSFSKELSPAANPFLSAVFTDEVGTIDVSYYSGSDFNIVTEQVKYTR